MIFSDSLPQPPSAPRLSRFRTGSPVVPVFIVRNGDGTHTIHIEPPLEHPVTGDRKEDERALTASFTKVIEQLRQGISGAVVLDQQPLAQ